MTPLSEPVLRLLRVHLWRRLSTLASTRSHKYVVLQALFFQQQ